MKRQTRLLLDTVLLGAVGALSAQAFLWALRTAQSFFLNLIAGYCPPGLPQEGSTLQQVIGPHGLWLIPAVTTLGGLLSGLLVYSLAPEAEGHGTDSAVKAFHQAGGYIRARVPFVKMIASAITIGSGGAAGREGPTALISAGIGSLFATLQRRTEQDRRLLVLIGMAAGLSAIFRSPIGTAFFAIEVLYSGMEFDASALLYTMVASIVAFAINGLFVGWQPLFRVPAGLQASQLSDYIWYVALGLLAGLIGTLLPMVFYGFRDLFHKLRIPPHFKPAIGGLGVGLMALALPQVLGGGYGWIQEAIDGKLAVGLLLVLAFAKVLAFSLTVSSGGSGGIFAPSLFVGAMFGGFLAQLFHQPSAAFVVVGMAAVFSGAARVPIATLLMVTEMTGGFQLLVPAALAVMLSYLVQVTLSARLKYQSLYEAQVPGRVDSPAHMAEHVEAILGLLRNGRLLLPASISHVDLLALLSTGVPVDLPDGKQLLTATLTPSSPLIGAAIQPGFSGDGDSPEDIEIVAVLRKGTTLLPSSHRVMRYRPGDRLLTIVAPDAKDALASHIGPPSPVAGGAS
jgi:CIC family chloride channel protein